MSVINNVNLIGRLTAAPKTFEAKGYTKVLATLAVSRPVKDKNGNKITDFIPVQSMSKTGSFNPLATRQKGELIAVSAELRTNNYVGKDGQPVYDTVIWVTGVQYLESNAAHNAKAAQAAESVEAATVEAVETDEIEECI
jgi:single-strand DNA-binding protein